MRVRGYFQHPYLQHLGIVMARDEYLYIEPSYAKLRTEAEQVE